MTGSDLAGRLRALPVFEAGSPTFDPTDVPPQPAELFERWLIAAADAGVAEPHAMTLSTVDRQGRPDARVLILKNLDEQGWWFATDSTSAKGEQLAAVPAAALTFYWREQGRQVRVRGPVRAADAQTNTADFAARGLSARAVALASRESRPLSHRAELEAALARVRARLADEPGLVAAGWARYVVAAEIVEFWQADPGRAHVRLQYLRTPDGWRHRLLWP